MSDSIIAICFLSILTEVRALWQVPANLTIDVPTGSALSRGVGISEAALQAKPSGKCFMIGVFGAIIQSKRPSDFLKIYEAA
jgi:hypothetical protein